MANLDFGLWITAMGMGTVFLLLIVLMLVLQLLGRLDRRRHGPAVDDPAPTGPTPIGLTEDEVAAITVAVIAHARRRDVRPAMPTLPATTSRWIGVSRGFQLQPWRRA